MKVVFMCNGEIINNHSKGFNGWSNPFEIVPNVGDFILLGEHNFPKKDFVPMKKYVVNSRTFSALEDYNNKYSKQQCIVELGYIGTFGTISEMH